MLEIQCKNATGFDEATQSYHVCNQKIRLSEERIGSQIKCPKCKQPIKVQSPEASLRMENSELTDRRSSQDVMSMEFDDAQASSSSVFTSKRQRCPKCGGFFSDFSICESCGFVDPVQDAQRRQQSSSPLRPAGFQLWLSSIATEGVSLGVIGNAIFAGGCLFCLIVMAWGVLSTSIIGALVTTFAAFLLFFLILVFLKTRQLATVRNAELGVLSPFWNAVLFLARLQKWQNYDSNLKGRLIIDCRLKPVDDQQLVTINGLKNCSVLDLENCDITDKGLKSLYGLSKLQCLVVRNTQVTDEAVTTLQQHCPRLWVWK